jgi:hypothetical protein
MALSGNRSSASGWATSPSAETEGPAGEPRALVPVSEPAPEGHPIPLSRRPAAPFLAQLIATARGEPQTRERRRAEPETAAHAYAAAAARANSLTFGRS